MPASVRTALAAAQIPPEAVAIVVQPLMRGGTTAKPAALIQHQAERPMNPASVMKLLTTYAALDILGPAYAWQTRAWSAAPLNRGVLEGDLILEGSGDPKFLQEHLQALLRQLRQRGIERIRGNLLLDRRAFEIAPTDSGAFDSKPMRPYNVGPDALLVNFRALRFVLSPEGEGIKVWAETPADNFQVTNELRPQPGACGSDWKDAIQTRLLREGERDSLIFSGSYPASCGERTLSLAPLDADRQMAGLFRALWRELGGIWGGNLGGEGNLGEPEVRSGDIPSGAHLLATQESPSLLEVVRDINKFSNNVMARQLYLSLGREADAPATPARAEARIRNWLRQRALHFPELVLENGSGLSRRERLSAQSLTRLLADAWQSPVMPEFMSSLPIVGVDGTMKKRLTEAGAKGRAHIKTGTLEGVKTVAGYMLDRKGQRYVVVCLINHPRAAAGQAAMDALLEWVATQ